VLVIKATNSGFGLLWMSKPAKLLGFISVIAPNKEPKNFGMLCQVFTVSVRSLTQIFGELTLFYSLHSGTRLLARSLVKPIILSDLTVKYANVFPDYFAWHFLQNLELMALMICCAIGGYHYLLDSLSHWSFNITMPGFHFLLMPLNRLNIVNAATFTFHDPQTCFLV
jgi:hypothetical protein